MTMLEGGPEGTMVRSGAVALPPAAPVRSRRGPVALDTAWVNRSQAILAVAAFAMAAAAVWVTLRADFLAYPGWLAAQKADIILGPVLVGLYWLRRRPASRFGPLLIAIGFLSARTSCSPRPRRGRSASGCCGKGRSSSSRSR